jgi:hypothetical protein
MIQSTYPRSRRAAVLSDFGEADNLSVREIATPAIRFDDKGGAEARRHVRARPTREAGRTVGKNSVVIP